MRVKSWSSENWLREAFRGRFPFLVFGFGFGFERSVRRTRNFNARTSREDLNARRKKQEARSKKTSRKGAQVPVDFDEGVEQHPNFCYSATSLLCTFESSRLARRLARRSTDRIQGFVKLGIPAKQNNPMNEQNKETERAD